MDILQYNYTRIPFLVLPYIDKDIAVPKEIIFDEDTNALYIRSLDGSSDIEVGKSFIEEVIDIEVNIIKKSVSQDGNTFEKIVNLYEQLILWKNTIMNSTNEEIVSGLSDILDKFRDMEKNDPTILQALKSKVNKIDGYGLSSNDFSNELLDKLTNISNEANNYSHPINQQCGYKAPVATVNGKVGDLEITKLDLGLENVQEGAIRYVHPIDKQCEFKGISSVNGKTGIVTIDKAMIGLSSVQNEDVVDPNTPDMLYTTNKYVTPHSGNSLLSRRISLSYPNLNKTELDELLLKEYIYVPTFNLNINTTPSDAIVRVFYNGGWNPGKTHVVPNGTYTIEVSRSRYNTRLVTTVINNAEKVENIILSDGNIIFGRSYRSIFLMPDSTISVCGLNYSYQLGIPGKSHIKTVENVPNLSNIKQVSGGNNHIMLLKYDGSVIALGSNQHGQLGSNSTIPSNIKEITCTTNSSTFFLLNDGTVRCVGWNDSGELGLGHRTHPITTIRTIAISNVKKVACGNNHTLFLLNDGTVKCTGNNTLGQLGLGHNEGTAGVIQTVPISNVADIICGQQYTIFIMQDGTIKCTGSNASGQLGLGHTNNINTITPFPISNVKQIACGGFHTMVLLNDGTVKGCGHNGSGQLGLGTNINAITLTTIPISNVKQVSCGSEHTLFLMNDGVIKGVGANTGYQLGLDDYVNRSTIVSIPNITL